MPVTFSQAVVNQGSAIFSQKQQVEIFCSQTLCTNIMNQYLAVKCLNKTSTTWQTLFLTKWNRPKATNSPVTSGDRYCRVWMSSLKCLCVQQAFPRSTITTRTVASSSVKLTNLVSPSLWKVTFSYIDAINGGGGRLR